MEFLKFYGYFDYTKEMINGKLIEKKNKFDK